MAACQPGRAAEATGTGSTAHRGARAPLLRRLDWVRLEETYRATGFTWLGGLTGVRSLRGEPPPAQGGTQILGQDFVDAPGTAQPHFQLIDRVVEFRGRATVTHSAVLGSAG